MDAALALRVAEHITRALAEPVRVAEAEVVVSGSVGIALGPGEYQTPGELLRGADAAVYVAKKRGKAQTVLQEPGTDGGARQLEPGSSLKRPAA